MRSPESRAGHRPGRTFEDELNLRYLSPGAFTVLSPEDRGSPPDPSTAPPHYRVSPNARRHRNQAFSIIAEPVITRSRSPSPTGRVSPFRGRGFNPTGSRHTSPAPSPPPPQEPRRTTVTNVHHYQQNPNRNNINQSKKSQIPQLKRRGSAILYSESIDDSDGSPKYRRKNGSVLKPQLSKSLNNVSTSNNNSVVVVQPGGKPPINPAGRRHVGVGAKVGFSRLSPIIGSSPEPSSDAKSLSSPKKVKSHSTPSSRKVSPSRLDTSDTPDTPETPATPDTDRDAESPEYETRDRRGNVRSNGSSRNASPERKRNGDRTTQHTSPGGKRNVSRRNVSSREASPDGKRNVSRRNVHSREASPDGKRNVSRRNVSSREASPEGKRNVSRRNISSRETSPERKRNVSRRNISSRETSPEGKRNVSRRNISSRETSPEGKRNVSRRNISSRETSPEARRNGNVSRETSPDDKRRGRRVTNSNTASPEGRKYSTSTAASRNHSRNVSRETSPNSRGPMSPTRIPIRNSVASKNAKTTTTNKAKVPTTRTQEIRSRIAETNRNKANLSRTGSVNKNVSKTNTSTSRYLNNNSNTRGSMTNLRNSGSNSNLARNSNLGSNSNLARTRTVGAKTSSGSGANTKPSTTRSSSRSSLMSRKNEDKTNNNARSEVIKESEDATTTNANDTTESSDEITVLPSPTKPQKSTPLKKPPAKTKSNESLFKRNESVPRLTDMLPSTTAVVSTTTSTVTQPLKIEAKLDPTHSTGTLSSTTIQQTHDGSAKVTPMYMDEGRVLSAQSVSSAIERMNDTVLDSHTLLKDHNMAKLSPHTAAANSVGIGDSQPTTVPGVESAKPGQIVNNSVSNHTGNSVVVENNGNGVKSGVGKLISPDDTFGAKVNSYEKTANERMVEARTMVASDVQPIRITVQEKPNNIEVQSGNVRFPSSATNGVSPGSGAPPPPENNGVPQPQPPKSRCQQWMDKCRNKMPCACCKLKEPTEPKEKSEDESKGCFSFLKRKTKEETEKVIVTTAEDVEAAKKVSLLERLKCCKSNKVGDSTGCCSRGRKDSWVERRDSILSEPATLTKGEKCKNFLKSVFCCCLGFGSCSSCCKKKPPKMEEISASRRASMMSKKKSLTPTVLPPEEPKNKLDTSLVEYTSTMKAAIPVLPVWLAYFCCFFNVFAPGTGTVFSGLFCLCIGIPRFSQKDAPKPRVGSFIINTIIGCGQLFTVLFCLVGWGWSIWWGVIMIKVAKKHRKLKKIEKRLEAQEKAAAEAEALEKANAKDVEKGRS